MTPQVSKLLHRQAELAGKMHDGVSPAQACVEGHEQERWDLTQFTDTSIASQANYGAPESPLTQACRDEMRRRGSTQTFRS